MAASLTSNVEALRAYEEGLGYGDRYLQKEAADSFRRATQLDPQFAMAYYRLSGWESSEGDVPAARRDIAHAAQLAERLSLPREQKVPIQAAQLSRDARSDEATQILQTAIREFPREIELRTALGVNLFTQQKWADAIPVLEEIIHLDDRQALAYNTLAYCYAGEGDVPRAMAALDKYASLLPANDPNPIDTRGDVLAMNGRFDEAAANYRKNVEPNPKFPDSAAKVGLAYLYEGKYSLAEASVAAYGKGDAADRALAAGVLGDIEVGRGRVDRAVARYEEAAHFYATHDARQNFAMLLKAAEIFLEQGQPETALALGRRSPGPAAAGIRGLAYLVLKNEAGAEKEFTSFRASWTPLFGEHSAEKSVEFFRFLADYYGGRWQQVVGTWPQLYSLDQLVATLNVGRAYLEMGMLPEAERELRSTLQKQLIWANDYRIAFHNFLAYALAQYYLGRVLEQNGTKAEAVNAYQEFLSHFENSTAKLPQIAEARAALKRLM